MSRTMAHRTFNLLEEIPSACLVQMKDEISEPLSSDIGSGHFMETRHEVRHKNSLSWSDA